MEVTMFRKDIENFNCLMVEAGTNCPAGGDAGHGGRTKFSIANTVSTSWSVIINDEDGETHTFQDPSYISVVFGGDAECTTAIAALEFIVDTLKREAERNQQLSAPIEVDL